MTKAGRHAARTLIARIRCKWRRVSVPALAAILVTLVPSGPSPAAELRQALIVSDIHLDPFDGASPHRLAATSPDTWNELLGGAQAGPLPGFGQDSNAALLQSAVAAIRRIAPTPDLVVIPGDLIAHRFERRAAAGLGSAATAERVEGLAVNTALYVTNAIAESVLGKPVVVALGNNDSGCGDYAIAAHGRFLSGLRERVRALAGPHLVAADFEQTFADGGYYRMRHPTADALDVVVLNDVLWSTKYRDRCGGKAPDAALAMLGWLEKTLVDLRAAGRRAWLIHHIPVGIDGFTSLHRLTRGCRAAATAFLKEPFASRFAALLRQYGAQIELMISGHTHHDTYRVVRSESQVAAVDKVVPSISPIFGNDPSFQILSYDERGRTVDLATWSLSLSNDRRKSGWRREYIFSDAIGRSFSKDSVGRLAEELVSQSAAAGPTRRRFAAAYSSGRGSLTRRAMRYHACAVGALDVASYARCTCN